MACQSVVNVKRGDDAEMLLSAALCLCIGICSITDILRRTIDVRILLIFSIILTMCSYIEKDFNVENLVTAICLGGILAVISLLSSGAIGMGDVFLYSIILCFLGFQKGMLIVFLSIILAFFVALFLVIVKRKKKNYEMPLVPFVFAAYLYCLVGKII